MFSLWKTAIGQMFLLQNQDFDFLIKANWFSHVKFTMHSSASIFTLKKSHFSLNFLQLSVVWQPYLEVIRQVILQKLVNLFETLAPKLNGMFYAFLKKSDLLINSTCKVIELSLCICYFNLLHTNQRLLFFGISVTELFLEIHTYHAMNQVRNCQILILQGHHVYLISMLTILLLLKSLKKN